MVGGVCAYTRRACSPRATSVRSVRGIRATPLQPLQGCPLLVRGTVSRFCIPGPSGVHDTQHVAELHGP